MSLVHQQQKMCEGCGTKRPHYGLPAEGTERWCSGCAKSEGRGAVRLGDKMCEGCGIKRPSFGLPAERKRRWCGGCAAADGRGAVSLQQPKMCEGCGLKHTSFGLPGERKRRWCGGCAAAEGSGAVPLQQPKMCEGCGLKVPTYGLPAEWRRRWCSTCSQAHRGAVSLKTHPRPAQPREAVRGRNKRAQHAVAPAAKRHSNSETRRHLLGPASVKLEPADDGPVTATSMLQQWQLPLEDRQRLEAMVSSPGYLIEYGFHICDADADTSNSGAGGAALSWVAGSVVKPIASHRNKAGGWWLVHFVAGDRLEVLITASNCGTAWRPQGQQCCLEESSNAMVASADPSWQMLATSSDLVNAAEPQPAGATGHEQLATSVYSSEAVRRAMRRNTWQTDKTDEPALDLPGDACARLPVYTNASQTGPGAGFGAFASRALAEGEYIGEVGTRNLP